MNACRQTGLRGADRREMASTCYIAGPPLLSTPQLHDTHTHTHKFTLSCVSVWVLPMPSVLSCAPGGRERDGCPFFSLPLLLSSSILLLTHTRSSILPCSPLLLSFDLSPPRYLFSCSLLFSLHLSSSQLAYALSSSSLSLSGCLSASTSLPLISLFREETPAPSILSRSLLLTPVLSPPLFKLNS